MKALLLLLLLALSGAAMAGDQDAVRRAVAEGRLRPLTDIVATVQARYPGRIVDVDLEQPLRDLAATRDVLNANLPEGLHVQIVELAPKKVVMCCLSHYEVRSDRLGHPDIPERISNFLEKKTWIIDRFRKNRHKELDIRPLVVQMSSQNDVLTLSLLSHQGQPGISPREVLEKALGFSGEEALLSGIIKTKVEETAAPA